MNAIDLTKTPVLEMTRLFKTTKEKLFKAFITPDIMRQWWGPETMTVPVCELDPTVGGAWKTTMINAEKQEFTVTGEYTKVNPHHELEFTWGWLEDGVRGHETTVHLAFEEAEGGTYLKLTQGSFDDGCQAHFEGWTGGFNNLEAYLASNG